MWIGCLSIKGQQAWDKIPEFFWGHLIVGELSHLKALMGQFDKRGWRHSSEALMIKQVGKNFAQGRLPWFDAWSASLTSKWCFHAPGVVRSERFFINWFPNGYWIRIFGIASCLLKDVGSAGSLICELWLEAFAKAFWDGAQTTFNGWGYRQGAKGLDPGAVVVSDRWNVIRFNEIRFWYDLCDQNDV